MQSPRPIFIFLLLVVILQGLCFIVVKAKDDILFKTKFDYRFSIKSPFYLHNDNKTIPYFTASESVHLLENAIRLTSSVPNTNGSIWSQIPNPHKEWELHFAFKINGPGVYGGQGISFWYADRPSPSGSFYGVTDDIHGLGLIFDSSDHHSHRSVPFIYAFMAEHHEDVSESVSVSRSLGNCFREYRNNDIPFWVRLTYYRKELHVYTDVLHSGQGYTECFAIRDLDLPTGYYFGFGAATEYHLADDQEIIAFEAYEINPPEKKNKDRPYEQEHIKAHDEFKMTDELKEKIKKVEEQVKHARTEHENEVDGDAGKLLGINSYGRIVENQYKIIESLNWIHDKLDTSKLNDKDRAAHTGDQHAAPGSIQEQIQDLAGDIRQLTSIVNSLAQHVYNGKDDQQLVHTINKQINKLSEHVENTRLDLSQAIGHSIEHSRKVVDEVKADGAKTIHHSTLYYLIAFAGGCIVMYAFSLVVRMTRTQPKKFV